MTEVSFKAGTKGAGGFTAEGASCGPSPAQLPAQLLAQLLAPGRGR